MVSKTKTKQMTKETHSIHDVDALLLEKVILLKTSKSKDEKVKLAKEIHRLEKHFNEGNEKHINGHKYPERMKGFPDDIPMNVEEVLKLIDSVEIDYTVPNHYTDIDNLDGISVGNNRFEYVDKGWSKPKEMKPVHLFK